jgi:hypothetical protein
MTRTAETIVVIKNPRWKKTHAKTTLTYGASFCKFVSETVEGTTHHELTDENDLTCIDCRHMVAFIAIQSSTLSIPLKTILTGYINLAHKVEKYHNKKPQVKQL